MKIWEFVITGGPCAGKTVALNIIRKELTEKGFKVIIGNETATELICSGIFPWELEKVKFQELLMERAINKEKVIRKAAKHLEKDVVIFYDRGLLDGKAYVSDEEFSRILETNNFNEKQINNQYDGVFHLVTAANGAEKFYTLSNNEARVETMEEARILDKRTIDVWKDNEKLKIIDNSTDFEGKIERLLNEIYAILEV